MAFLYYSPVTINTGQVSGTQTNFPMLLNYTDVRFKSIANGGHVSNANGFDVRPYSDANLTSALTYELERYNASTGEVVMWVKGASVTDGLVTYLAYGNSVLTSDGSSTATWSNSYTYVYHLKDGTTLSLSDSSGNANTLTNTNTVTPTSGQIDGAAAFVSTSTQHLVHSAGTTVDTAVTMSAWINATSFPNAYNTVVASDNGGGTTKDIFVKSTGKLAMYVNAAGGQLNYDGTGTNTLSAGTWYYVTLTYDSSTGLIGKVNAGSDGTAAANGVMSTSNTVDIGNDPITGSRLWNGKIDEVHIASVVRSAGWITTEYNNQSAPTTFATLGAEVSNSPMGGLYTI